MNEEGYKVRSVQRALIKVSKQVAPPTALQNGTCDFHPIPLLNKMVVLSPIRLLLVLMLLTYLLSNAMLKEV